MSVYAKINSENLVENVILCEDKDINQLEGVYIRQDPAVTGPAIINSTYSKELNRFILPKPYPSWILNSENVWQSPVGPEPEGFNRWDETSQEWVSLS